MITSFDKYISKQNSLQQLISEDPAEDLNCIVIIPVYNEPDLNNTLNSIREATLPQCAIEIILLINHGEHTPNNVKEQNTNTYQKTLKWSEENYSDKMKFYPVLVSNFSKKHGGVGLARKLAMDEAILRFSRINKQQGIICSLDADTLIQKNYFVEIEKAFRKDLKLNVILPDFEHQSAKNSNIEHAIIIYEIYLRTFKLALAFTGFPYAFHTIGSAFAVSADAYVKQGGMNKKQGGEDFYFLQKIFQLNNTKELQQVKVYPSSRPSERVPFGTGPAINKIINEGDFLTYDPKYFKYLKNFFNDIDHFYTVNIEEIYKQLHPSIKEFVAESEFINRVAEIKKNSSSAKAFKQRFFRWFDAFKIIKYLNLMHLNNNRIPSTEAAKLTLKYYGVTANTTSNNKILELLKVLERSMK